jgi:hypothetical protein
MQKRFLRGCHSPNPSASKCSKPTPRNQSLAVILGRAFVSSWASLRNSLNERSPSARSQKTGMSSQLCCAYTKKGKLDEMSLTSFRQHNNLSQISSWCPPVYTYGSLSKCLVATQNIIIFRFCPLKS